MGSIFQDAISLTGTFNLWLLLTIFAITMIAEFGFSVPYLLETIWLLVGYHAIGGTISPGALLIFCIISLIGREIGAFALYKISGYGRSPLIRLLQKVAQEEPESRQPWRFLKRRILFPVIKLGSKFYSPHPQLKSPGLKHELKTKGKSFCPSILNIVLGRFSWLKIPITVTAGLTKNSRRLLLGVGLFSLAWDGLYILLGVFGAGNKISSFTMLASTISAFILINALIYFIRRLRSSRRMANAG